MTLQDWGSIGELVAAIATVATLFYLAMQIRHSTEATRAASQQALLDTFFDSGWELGRDRKLARLIGTGLVRFESLDDGDKTAFTLVLMRYVGNLEKGLRLRDAGLIDEETLESVGRNLVACIKAPGGAQWWAIVGPHSPPIVTSYMERKAKETSVSWDKQLPFWVSWVSESQTAPHDSDSEPAA